MERRNFIYSGTLGSLALFSLSSIEKQIFTQQKIKITLTPWSIIRSGYGSKDPLDISVLEYPHVANSLGFDYIDHEMFHFPPNLDTKYIDKMNRSMKIAGVKSAVMLTGGVGDIADSNTEKRRKAIEIYKYWIDIASQLECKAVRNVCASYITIPKKEKLLYAIKGVKELGEYAASKNIDLLIENHNGYSSDPKWMIELMENVNMNNVGVLGDFSNWTLKQNPEILYPDPYRGIEILSPYIKAVSAKSENFNSQGEETKIDYKMMFSILKKAPNLTYAGVEFFGRNISREEGSLKTKNLIEKVIVQV